MAEHQLKSIHPEEIDVPEGVNKKEQDIPKVEPPKNLIEIYVAIAQDGQLAISAQNSESKNGVPMGVVREVLQKALNRVNDDVIIGCVTSQIQKLMAGGKLTQPGFRPSIWQKLTGK